MKRFEFKFAENVLVRSFFKDILTGKDGTSYDAGRVMGFVGGVAFVAFGFAQAYEMVTVPGFQEFPFANFGIGFGSVAAGIGMLLALKKDTEPASPAAEPPK
jgi:hypothetical protein